MNLSPNAPSPTNAARALAPLPDSRHGQKSCHNRSSSLSHSGLRGAACEIAAGESANAATAEGVAPVRRDSLDIRGTRECAEKQRGFTLIELLTVIAIIGILAAIMIPTLSGSRARTQRIVDASNLSQILKAAVNYAADHNDRLPNPDLPGQLSAPAGVFLWPGLLARAAALSEPSMYFSALDPAFSGQMPAALLNPQNRNLLDASFTAGRELCWEFVGGLRMSDPATTPVAFTRGLLPSGSWDPANGVYGDSGGYVVFLGGNVEFFSDSAVGKFIHTQTGQRTDNLLDALPRRPGIKVWATSRGGIGSPGGTPAPSQ